MGAYVNAADPRGVSLLPASVIAEIASLGLNLAGSLCCAAFCSGRFFLGDVHPLFCFFFLLGTNAKKVQGSAQVLGTVDQEVR